MLSRLLILNYVELFRETLSEKIVHAKISKGNMRYDQYTVPDLTVAVESSVFAFLKEAMSAGEHAL